MYTLRSMAEWRPASVFIKTRFVLGAVFEANAALTLHPATISILVSVFSQNLSAVLSTA